MSIAPSTKNVERVFDSAAILPFYALPTNANEWLI
jgi:hypothetical protein